MVPNFKKRYLYRNKDGYKFCKKVAIGPFCIDVLFKQCIDYDNFQGCFFARRNAATSPPSEQNPCTTGVTVSNFTSLFVFCYLSWDLYQKHVADTTQGLHPNQHKAPLVWTPYLHSNLHKAPTISLDT